MNSDDSFDVPHQEYRKPRYTMNVRIMISALIVLVLVVSLVILLHVYARWIWTQAVRFSRRRRRRFHFSRQEPASLCDVGLDSAMLETLPTFLYKPQNLRDSLDCAICLCEFEENEEARFLPNCRHTFHVECIDMWFRSHSTCPVCRTGAQPKQLVLESFGIEQVSVTFPRSVTSGFHDNLN